jgi:quinol monooxygenase YgiN
MFVQIMDYRTTDRDAMAALEEEWRAQSVGERTTQRVLVGRDRNDPERYLVMAFFEDEAAAQANYEAQSTVNAADRQAALLIGSPTFIDLEIVKDVHY